MTVVLKLGGSVVTEKDAPETVDEEALDRAAAAVADYGGDAAAGPGHGAWDLVLVHGAGSFGHVHADRHGVTPSQGTRDAAAVRAIHASMGRLDAAVLDALGDAGVPAVPVRPLSLARRDADGDLSLPAAGVRTMLGEGFVPVLHGDVVVHESEGATILSGDEIVASLARSLDADRVGVCSTVPGVLDADGEVVPAVRSVADVADALGESDATDVTGGMAGKVRTLLDLDVPARVFGLDALAAFLDGGPAGTLVDRA